MSVVMHSSVARATAALLLFPVPHFARSLGKNKPARAAFPDRFPKATDPETSPRRINMDLSPPDPAPWNLCVAMEVGMAGEFIRSPCHQRRLSEVTFRKIDGRIRKGNFFIPCARSWDIIFI